MQIFHSIEEIPPDFRPTVVTIGNFDGVHRGHQAIIADVIQRARELQAHSVAITFDPHPARILRPHVPLHLITQPSHKLALLAETGIEAVLVLPFTPSLSKLTAEQFARTILAEALGAIEIHEGENFRFGAGAHAGMNEMAALGETLQFKVQAHAPTARRGLVVSSSAVRAAIAAGDMHTARQLLGRPFDIFSTPASGRGYGARYTVPTINLAPVTELLPANGVYITCLDVDGEIFSSVTNVGNRPTFGEDSFAVESHILDFHPISLQQDTSLHLSFLKRIRAEKQWPSSAALKEQILRDVAHARHYFGLLTGIAGRETHSSIA